jgi:anti-sigma B factor antagonist
MMECQAATREAGQVAIIDLKGGLTVASGIGLLRQQVKSLVAAGHKNVLVNLKELIYLDSAGMGELVSACTTLRNLGGDLRLVSPQERVRNLLQMTKLASIFSVFGDEQAALRSF